MVSPDIVQYDASTRAAAISEIKGGSCPVLTEFAKDYKVMRDQTRAMIQ